MQKQKKPRGRPPSGEFQDNAVILTARVRREIRTSVEQLAKRHRRSLSQEMQKAFDDWISNCERSNRKPHISKLLNMIALLAEWIEKQTGEPWHEDAFTGEQLRLGVEFLIFHFAKRPKTPGGPTPIPPKVEKANKNFLAASEHAKQTGDSRLIPGMRGVHLPGHSLGESEAGMMITYIENAWAEDKPWIREPDEYGFWQILRDLGSGWKRSQEVWQPTKETHK